MLPPTSGLSLFAYVLFKTYKIILHKNFNRLRSVADKQDHLQREDRLQQSGEFGCIILELKTSACPVMGYCHSQKKFKAIGKTLSLPFDHICRGIFHCFKPVSKFLSQRK